MSGHVWLSESYSSNVRSCLGQGILVYSCLGQKESCQVKFWNRKCSSCHSGSRPSNVVMSQLGNPGLVILVRVYAWDPYILMSESCQVINRPTESFHVWPYLCYGITVFLYLMMNRPRDPCLVMFGSCLGQRILACSCQFATESGDHCLDHVWFR